VGDLLLLLLLLVLITVGIFVCVVFGGKNTVGIMVGDVVL